MHACDEHKRGSSMKVMMGLLGSRDLAEKVHRLAQIGQTRLAMSCDLINSTSLQESPFIYIHMKSLFVTTFLFYLMLTF